MRYAVELLQAGIVITTPVFFLVVLLTLWKIVRTQEVTLAVAVYVKRQLELVRENGTRLPTEPPQTEIDAAEQDIHPPKASRRVRGGGAE